MEDKVLLEVKGLKKYFSMGRTSTSVLLPMPKPLTVWITKTVENS